MRLCHECSEDIVRSGMWVLVVLLILVTTVVALVGSHLVEDVNIVANHADSSEIEARVQRHLILWKCRNFLVKIFPFSAFRIVVVVLEIITQVYTQELCNLLGLYIYVDNMTLFSGGNVK